MIRVNLLPPRTEEFNPAVLGNPMKDRKPLFFGPKSYFTEYLICNVIGHSHSSGDVGKPHTLAVISPEINQTITLPPLTPELQEKLLGKAPLRLIASRTKVENWFEETLECGHSYTAYQNFLWDEGGHLVNLEPSAKRRRCVECKKASQVSLPPSPDKKPVQSVTLNNIRSRRIK